jgi:hypothetical protein
MMRSLALCVVLAACGGSQHPSGAVDADDAVFYLRSNVADANVYVDGRFVGPVNVLRGGIAVDAGKHRLELRRDDYFSRYVDLDLGKGERKKLLVTLAPVLP